MAGEVQEYDMRVLIPIQRHQKLGKLFKEMKAGESFIFINDHDPKPVYYEFQSIYGDVVGWEYLNKGGREWKVKVTKKEETTSKKGADVSTMIDLRKTADKDRKYVVFHRYGMMEEGDVMELLAAEDPIKLKNVFTGKFADRCSWEYKKQEPGEVIIHITKNKMSDPGIGNIPIVNEFDVRPFHPAKRHEMVFQAFDDIQPGEAFVFTNDHDPKPLYYQIEAESNIPFKWEYMKSGEDDEWTVKVSKTKEK